MSFIRQHGAGGLQITPDGQRNHFSFHREIIDEKQARRTIEKWRASGLGVVQFTKREGISVGMFYRMRAKADGPASAADPCIVPVMVRSKSVPASTTPGSPFEVELASGVKIRVGARFDAKELVRLVEVSSRHGPRPDRSDAVEPLRDAQ